MTHSHSISPPPEGPDAEKVFVQQGHIRLETSLSDLADKCDITLAVQAILPGLTVVATPLGNLADISLRAVMTLMQADMVLCEDTRHTLKLMTFLGIKKRLIAYHDHSTAHDRDRIVAWLQQGKKLALVSDAGMPLVSDPGYKLVAAIVAAGLDVQVIPGPSAGITALVASGLPTDRYHFFGFPPSKDKALGHFLTSLEPLAGTLVFYESPQRIDQLAAKALTVLGDRPCCVARELTKKFETYWRGTLDTLVAYTQSQTFRGECVVLIGGKEVVDSVDEATWRGALATLMRDVSASSAVDQIATAFGIPKRDVYKASLQLREATSQGTEGNVVK